MSETNPTPNTPRVEGELSLDDLSQIAGGTSADPLALDASALSSESNASVLVDTNNVHTSFVGAKGSNEHDTLKGAMNVTLVFP